MVPESVSIVNWHLILCENYPRSNLYHVGLLLCSKDFRTAVTTVWHLSNIMWCNDPFFFLRFLGCSFVFFFIAFAGVLLHKRVTAKNCWLLEWREWRCLLHCTCDFFCMSHYKQKGNLPLKTWSVVLLLTRMTAKKRSVGEMLWTRLQGLFVYIHI